MKKRFIILPSVLAAVVIVTVSIALAGCPQEVVHSDFFNHTAKFSVNTNDLSSAIKETRDAYEAKFTFTNEETASRIAESQELVKEVKQETPGERLARLTYSYNEDNYLYTFIAADGFDSYKWIIDGTELTKYDDRVYLIEENVLKILPCSGYNFDTEEFAWKIEDSQISLVAEKDGLRYTVEF